MRTRTVKIDPADPQPKELKEAAQTIARGGLVIIPTETVYGIAANMSSQRAMIRLAKIKDRPKDKAFTVHIARKEKIEDFARGIPVSAYKLAEKFWPGPLTMVLKSASEGTVGLRMPDNQVALKIIDLAGVPIVCPSANLSGRPAPRNFTEALADLEGQVELALDAGATKLGVESTVVDLSGPSLQLLREGAIKKEAIEEVARKKIVVFVCTGNSCRSVMAEALLKKKLKEKNRQDVEVLSAGIMMLGGLGATEATQEVLRKEGMDVSGHRSQRITKELIKKADLILVMERLHEERILQLAPEVKNRVFLLKEFAKIKDNAMNIEDPIGKTVEFYAQIFAVIKDAVERIVELI